MQKINFEMNAEMQAFILNNVYGVNPELIHHPIALLKIIELLKNENSIFFPKHFKPANKINGSSYIDSKQTNGDTPKSSIIIAPDMVSKLTFDCSESSCKLTNIAQDSSSLFTQSNVMIFNAEIFMTDPASITLTKEYFDKYGIKDFSAKYITSLPELNSLQIINSKKTGLSELARKHLILIDRIMSTFLKLSQNGSYLIKRSTDYIELAVLLENYKGISQEKVVPLYGSENNIIEMNYDTIIHEIDPARKLRETNWEKRQIEDLIKAGYPLTPTEAQPLSKEEIINLLKASNAETPITTYGLYKRLELN